MSTDLYEFALKRGAKDGYKLIYDSSSMGMFNEQGIRGKAFYESLQGLSPRQQVYIINEWIRGINPKARLAHLENGKVRIPHPKLVKTK